MNSQEDYFFRPAKAREILLNHFNFKNLESFGLEERKLNIIDNDQNPSLTLLTDWITTTGNTELSIEMLENGLDQINRSDVILERVKII